MSAGAQEGQFGHITSTRLRQCLDLWLSMWCRGRELPRKAHLDPVALAGAKLMPHVFLLERSEGGFRFRLAGEEIRRNYTGTVKGMMVTDLIEARSATVVEQHCGEVLETPCVSYIEGTVSGGGLTLYDAQRLLLPLADGDGAPAFVLGCVDKRIVTPRYVAESQPSFMVRSKVATPVRDIEIGDAASPVVVDLDTARTTKVETSARPAAGPGSRDRRAVC